MAKKYALADKANKKAYGSGFKTPEYVKKLREKGEKMEKQEDKLAKERAKRHKKEGLR